MKPGSTISISRICAGLSSTCGSSAQCITCTAHTAACQHNALSAAA
jgi:hypothetical protein